MKKSICVRKIVSIALILCMFTTLLLSLSNVAYAVETIKVTLCDIPNVVEVHTKIQTEYLADDYRNITDYGCACVGKDFPKPLSLSWSVSGDIDLRYTPSYIVHLSNALNKEFLTYETIEQSIDIYNLYVGANYSVYVEMILGGNSYNSAKSNFKTISNAPRLIKVDGTKNFRDIGGYVTLDGYVTEQGLLYRSFGLDNLTQDGIKEAKEKLHIKTEIDLRNTIGSSPENGGRTVSYFGTDVAYYSCPIDQDFNGNVRKIFQILSDKSNYPILYHCSAGADRTGVLSYAFLSLLGVDEDAKGKDYMFTNFSACVRTLEQYEKNHAKFTNYTNGNSISDKVYNYLVEVCKVPSSQIDAFIRINKNRISTLKNINSCYIKIKNYRYTGEPILAVPVIKNDFNILTQGVDYTCKYSDNVNVGTGKAIIVGKNDYVGVATSNFYIYDKVIRGDADSDNVITVMDATCIQKYLSRLISEDEINLEAATMLSGELSITGATHIQRWLADIIHDL